MTAAAVVAETSAMWPYYPDLLARPVPRYTSFPTAAEFSGEVGAAELDSGLRAAQGDVSLYLHIPFCSQICWYCGCNTSRTNKSERLTSYLDSLHREIALVGARLDGRARVRRIAFGGGSPNAVAPLDFVRLVDTLTLQLPLYQPVLSIELDPRTLTPDWGTVIRCIGITRASMGVQTFAPHLQAAIGRIQPEAQIVRGTQLLRAAGVTSLNFDLMYGLPGQSEADLADTLERTIALEPERIALFGYAHVPHLISRQQRIDASALPDQAARFRMAWLGAERLAAAGYEPVGFDHFAKPGDAIAQAALSGRLHRNFQGFTEDDAPTMIGLGATAISAFPDVLVQNEKNAGRYRMKLSQDLLTGASGVRRSPADRETGKIIEQLLCHHRAEVGEERLRLMQAVLAPFGERGLIEAVGDQLRIMPGGLPYARTVAALFDPYRKGSPQRFSTAV